MPLQNMKQERKQKAEAPSVPVIERTPPSPHTSNGTPPQFNGSVVHTGRRASEPVSNDMLDLNTGRSSSFTAAPSVQLTPPPPRRLQKPLTLVCAI